MKTQINTLIRNKLDVDWNIYILSKLPFQKYKIAIGYRSKMSGFTWKNHGRHLLNEVINVSISSKRTK